MIPGFKFYKVYAYSIWVGFLVAEVEALSIAEYPGAEAATA